MDRHYDEEVRRLTEALALVVRVGDQTRQSIERRLGMSSGYLSKILGGTVDLRARHILAISAAAGIDPGDFFAIAVPRTRSTNARLLAEFQAALGQRASAEAESDADFDERVKRSLARLLGLRLGEPEP
ncbi:MAG TPA: hypothetical protein VFE33_28855 [Thermoanaerobaculia bacterium]|nr:hypothetical protein [Thermoanaerobaculia bacterium]